MRCSTYLSLGSLILGCVTGQLATAQPAGAPPAQPPPFGIEIVRTDVPEAGVFIRPIVTVGTNKFYFTAPRGFRVRADETQRRVYLEDAEGRCSITLRLRSDLSPNAKATNQPPNAAKPNQPPSRHDPFREVLLKQYSEARITEEYDAAAGGFPGAMFEFDWKTPAGLRLQTRTCFVPTPAGVFEFVLLTDPTQMTAFHGAFNSVLVTFRLAPPGGNLQLPVIPSRS